MKKFLFFSLVALMTCSSCSSFLSNINYESYMINKPNKAFNNGSTALNSDYVDSLKGFASDFYMQVNNGENQVFSPISIATCFSMLLDGAKEESKTELEALLHYDGSFNYLKEIQNMLLNNAIKRTKPDVTLDIAQSFWLDDSFEDKVKQEYIDKLTNYYFAEALQGDLSSNGMHNALADYINEKTDDFFELTGEDFKDFEGVMWLLNTIYLKSPWLNEFLEVNNMESTFTNLDNSESNVTYMVKNVDNYYYSHDDYLISSFELESSLKLNVLLPHENEDYEAILNNKENIDVLLNYDSDSVDNSRAHMHYRLPQFKLLNSYDLKEILLQMNVTKIFDPEEANLKDISDEDLYVGKAKHEAGIEVNNDGIEAAAYTIIEIRETSIQPQEDEDINFYVNHPFAYTITNGDGMPLFMGVIGNIE